MTIGLVLATYSVDPSILFSSIGGVEEEVKWYIFHHSTNEVVESRLVEFSRQANVDLHLYRENRGLSRSWNEGIASSVEDECEFAILLSDDLHFRPGGFPAFIKMLRGNPGFGLGFVIGLDIGGAHDGQEILQGFACVAIGSEALRKVGFFDQTFSPAYYEDLDYHRRILREGLSEVVAPGVLVEHRRSSTRHSAPEIERDLQASLDRNRAAYVKKWGEPGAERQHPFDRPSLSSRIDWEDRADPYPAVDKA